MWHYSVASSYLGQIGELSSSFIWQLNWESATYFTERVLKRLECNSTHKLPQVTRKNADSQHVVDFKFNFSSFFCCIHEIYNNALLQTACLTSQLLSVHVAGNAILRPKSGSTLDWVMTCDCLTKSHYLNKLSIFIPNGTRTSKKKNQWLLNQKQSICCLQMHFKVSLVNILRPRKNGLHFTDDIYICILLSKNIRVSIKVSLKFIPKGPIDNMSGLVQIMAWCRTDDKPLSE